MASWRIEFAESALCELRKSDPRFVAGVAGFFRERVAGLDDPRSVGEYPFGPESDGLWEYRVDDRRIIAKIVDDESRVVVARVGHLVGISARPTSAATDDG